MIPAARSGATSMLFPRRPSSIEMLAKRSRRRSARCSSLACWRSSSSRSRDVFAARSRSSSRRRRSRAQRSASARSKAASSESAGRSSDTVVSLAMPMPRLHDSPSAGCRGHRDHPPGRSTTATYQPSSRMVAQAGRSLSFSPWGQHYKEAVVRAGDPSESSTAVPVVATKIIGGHPLGQTRGPLHPVAPPSDPAP